MTKKSKTSNQSSGVEPPDLEYVAQLLAAEVTQATADATDATVLDATESVVVARDSDVADSEGGQVMSDVNETISGPVALPGQCMLRDAVELKPVLLQHAAQPELNIDVSAVERIDAAFMQTLLALVKQRQEQQLPMPTWQGSSAALQEAAHLLGLQTQLQLPTAA